MKYRTKNTNMIWYLDLRIRDWRERDRILEMVSHRLQDRGYTHAELVPGDDHHFHGSIEPHIRFTSKDEAMMYVLTYGGEVQDYVPTAWFAGG